MNPTDKTRRGILAQHYFVFLVAAVVILAFVLRYFHANTGLPYLYSLNNWDEPYTANTALQMMKTGDYNPHFFNYGTLMIYFNLLVDKLYYFMSQSSGLTLHEIKTDADTGWFWTISHPGFYLWNRILTVLLGSATVLMTFFVGNILFNRWIGLLAALFLALLPIHIEYSALITTDVPVAFFVFSVVLFSLLFMRTEQKKYFIFSLVFVGFAIATKYNAGLTYLLPLVSLLWISRQQKKRCSRIYWYLLFLIPPIVFVLAMPYAVLDLPAFVKDVLHEMYHYKVWGHKGHESIPGWDHFSFQMRMFYENIGPFATIMLLIGLTGLFFRPLLALALIYPLLYILYMSGMKVNFHRNFIQIYPFIAVLVGAGYYYLHDVLNALFKNRKEHAYNIPLLATGGIAVLFFAFPAYSALSASWKAFHATDTRSRAVDLLNGLENIQRIVISEELRLHPQDLNRLKHPYAVMPLEFMGDAPRQEGTVYLIPRQIKSTNDDFTREADVKQAIIDKAVSDPSAVSLLTIGQASAAILNRYSVNPSMRVIDTMPKTEPDPSVISLDTCVRSSEKIRRSDANSIVLDEGNVTTPSYLLPAGAYRFNFTAKKEKSEAGRTKEFHAGAYRVRIAIEKTSHVKPDAGLKITVNKDGAYCLNRLVALNDGFTPFDVSFSMERKGAVQIVVEYICTPSEGLQCPKAEFKALNISKTAQE